ADLFLNALYAQDVAHGRMSFDEAEGDAAFCQFRVQRQEHPRAGQVHFRRRGEIADDQPQRFARGIDPREHGIEDVSHVEIDVSRLDAEWEHARRWLVVGVAREIGIAMRTWDAPEKGDMRLLDAADEEHHR